MREGEPNFKESLGNPEVSIEELEALLAKAGIKQKAHRTIVADLGHPDTKVSDREWLKRQLERIINTKIFLVKAELRRAAIKEWHARLAYGLRT